MRKYLPVIFFQSPMTRLKLFMAVVAAMMVFTGCTDNCEVEHQYTYYEPVYTSMEEIRASVATVPAQELSQVGKIYFKDGYLFINEPNEGVHVIDNRDPANPKNISFINIPGAFDLAVRGNILFSDSYIDLVAIDISDLEHITEVGRIEGLFQGYNSYGFHAHPVLGVVTDWKVEKQVSLYEDKCEAQVNYSWGRFYEGGIALASSAKFDVTAAVAPTNPGMAGSMARFALTGEHLYAIDQSDLYPIDVSRAANMIAAEKVYVDWGIETIFPKGDKLFLGAQSGMFIMDISNPLEPVQISSYQHIRSCDPVIVDDEYAYVTLRSGTACQGFTNQLEVIDISEITDPVLLYTYEMHNPHGLGKDEEVLFICDGSDGLKVYDASDVAKIDENLLAHYKNIQAFDIIPYNDVAMMIGEDGLYQYDYSDLNNIKLLSHIQIQKDEL